MNEPLRVFISNAQEDQAFAEELSRALVERGVDAKAVWGLEPGKSFEEQLREALLTASVHVVLVSEETLRSPSVFFELGAALGEQKPVLPVYLTDRARADAPPPLRAVSAIEAKALRPDEVAERVVEAAAAA